MNPHDRKPVNRNQTEELMMQIVQAEKLLEMLDEIDASPDGIEDIFDAKSAADARHGIIYAMSQNALTKALNEQWAAEHSESPVSGETTGESATEHIDITPNPA